MAEVKFKNRHVYVLLFPNTASCVPKSEQQKKKKKSKNYSKKPHPFASKVRFFNIEGKAKGKTSVTRLLPIWMLDYS